MNLKSILVVLTLVVAGAGVFFLSQGDDAEEQNGMTNGVPEEVQTTDDSSETSLVGKGNSKAAEAGRTTVPEQASVEEVPGAVKVVAETSNEVFAQVVDAQGQGLEGVDVLIKTLNAGMGFGARGWHGPGVTKVQSGKEGRVAFGVSSAPFLVKLAEPGFVGREIEFQGGMEAGEDLGAWALTRALTLTGRVVGPNGNPVAGAQIIAPQDGGIVVVMNGKPEAVAETDQAGRFSIETLKPGTWRLLVHSGNHPDQIFAGEASTELQQTGLVWTLKNGATLRGRLTGRPTSNTDPLAVRMDLAYSAPRASLWGGVAEGFPRLGKSVELQPDGTFVVTGLHTDSEYRIRLVAKSKNGGAGIELGRSFSKEKNVLSSAGTVNLVWATSASLRLLVLDAETSRPVELYSLTPEDWEYYGSLRGDSEYPEGLAEISGIPPTKKPMVLRIQADGYEPYTLESIEFNAGRLTDLGTILLKPGALCQIQVVDGATGESVKGARIELASIEPREEEDTHTIGGFDLSTMGSEPMRQNGKTDEEGLVSLRYVEGTLGEIKARHSRYAKAELVGIDLSNFRTEPMRLELWKGGELHVLVLDDQGDPVRGVKVELSPARKEEKSEGISFSVGPPGFMGNDDGFSRNTNRKGLVRFKHVPAGEYRCNVSWPGSSGGMGIVMIVDDSDASEPEDPTGQLVTIKEGGSDELTMAAPLRSTLEGIILENGTPLIGARISAEKAGGVMMISSMGIGGDDGVRTDRDGHFLLENLDPGKVTVTVKHDLRAMDYTQEIELFAGANDFSVKLQVASVSGRVVDLAGNGIEGIRISAEKVTEGVQRRMVMTSVIMVSDDDSEGGGREMTSAVGDGRKPTITDSEGRFELRGVLPNKGLKIVAEGKNLATVRSKEMTIAEGSLRSGIKLTMSPGCKLTVRVVDNLGDPIAHALVRLAPIAEEGEESGGTGPSKTTDNNGEATFDSLKPSTVNVSAFRVMQGPPDNLENTPVTVEVLNPKELEITID